MAATQQKVAIKKCPNAFEDLVDAKRIVREIRLLMHFRHENIVRVRLLLGGRCCAFGGSLVGWLGGWLIGLLVCGSMDGRTDGRRCHHHLPTTPPPPTQN